MIPHLMQLLLTKYIEANMGNNYNVTTGKFLCDHTGLYYFSAARRVLSYQKK